MSKLEEPLDILKFSEMLKRKLPDGRPFLYQSVPFEEFSQFKARRDDCEERWSIIKQNIGDLSGKKMVDIGCANGFFGFRFLQDGGKEVCGIEREADYVEFIKELASQKGMNFYATKWVLPDTYDIGIYLDLEMSTTVSGYGYLCYLRNNSKINFVSPSGTGNNENLLVRLEPHFGEIIPIYEGFQGRKIFRCTK